MLALHKWTPDRIKKKFLVKYIAKPKEVDGTLARILQGEPSGWLLAFIDIKLKIVLYFKQSSLWQNLSFSFDATQALISNLTGQPVEN